MEKEKIAVVGGGIVGLATAYQLLQMHPNKRVVVLEKEDGLGAHQSGHNSGVLHSGIYYKPGSLKAQNCRTGKEAMERFCSEHDVEYDICGKVIVAVDNSELPALKRIYECGQENGVRCEMIDVDRLAELEPHARGVQAIHVPEAGIVNFRQVCVRLGELIEQAGSEVRTSTRVIDVRRDTKPLTIETDKGDVQCDYMVNCGGLHCDRVGAMTGQKQKSLIVPFRGEYYELKPEAKHLCRNLIYPVPDPKFPFLGVHFTRTIGGGIECGPNAVLAFAREGYRKRDVNFVDLMESLSYIGFQRLAWKYWRVGMGEMWRSFSKSAFVKALQHLMPEIRNDDLVPGRAGVRAMAVGPDGAMVDDFVINSMPRIVNVGNAPSPAATSSLNVGRLVAEELQKQF
ncbi:MAG: L-2-hydroxyglutarate oxidase [Pirellulaceae bacterium]|jgi:L-2-hydroxyglutarate oxidase